MIEAGQIVTVWFPFSHIEPDPYKRRPVLVLGVYGSGDDQAILVTMITSNARRVSRPHPEDVLIPDHDKCGLPQASVVRATRLWTAQTRDIAGIVGKVPASVLEDVRDRLRPLLGM